MSRVDNSGTSNGKITHCDRCGTKVDSGYNSRLSTQFGIHPALAKRYEKIESANQSSLAGPVAQKPAPPQPEQCSSLPKIDGYEVIEKTGKGAMGCVYRAVHLASGREAALKILSADLAKRVDLVARFEREAAALRAFRHRNVVAIFDSGSSNGIHYYSMEFVVGTTLRKFVKAGPLKPKVAIRFARQIAQALLAAHRRGIIHRDLKPENIIIEAEEGKSLDGNERLVLVDFGLAGILNEAADPHPNLTHSRVSMGTVNYMAPEQHIDAKRVDFRTDLFACGVILYECLTGDLPLGRFAMPKEKGVQVPQSVDDCLIKALARSAKERFQSASDFDEVLSIIESELDQQPSKVPVRPKKRRGGEETVYEMKRFQMPSWLKRPQTLLGAAALIVFTFLGITISKTSPSEVAISKTGVVSVVKGGEFKAPAPLVTQPGKSKKKVASLGGPQEPLVLWESESPVWSYEKNALGYFAQQGEAGHFRRDFSFGVSPSTLDLSKPVSLSARMQFKRMAMSADDTKIQHSAREVLGSGPGRPAGGIFLVNKKDRRAVGMVVYADGYCAINEVSRSGAFLTKENTHLYACTPPLSGKKVDLRMECDASTSVCVGYVGKKKVASEVIESLSNTNWHVSLGCRNINCLFGG